MDIRREKIDEAIIRCTDIFRELGLEDDEIEIVHRSGWVGIKAVMMEKEAEESAANLITERKRATLDKIIEISPTIIACIALIISLIGIVLKLMR
jgi:hypothetical protein